MIFPLNKCYKFFFILFRHSVQLREIRQNIHVVKSVNKFESNKKKDNEKKIWKKSSANNRENNDRCFTAVIRRF